MNKNLSYFIEKINEVFLTNKDRYKAHELCRPFLLEMAGDENIFFEIVKQNISKPGFFEKKRINPVVAFDIEINEFLSFVAHCWIPLPNNDTNISHQSIHHHGKLLLTSVAAFGTGYESVIFKQNFSINKQNNLTKLEIDKIYANPYLNIEFIDINTPHIVFYPAQFSVTYALWSNNEVNSAESLKKLSFIKKYKKQIRKLIDKLNLAPVLGLNTSQYLDFYPHNGQVLAMKERLMYPVASNDSFINAVFYVLQKSGFNDYVFLEKFINASANKNNLSILFNKFKSGEEIKDKLEPAHMNIAKVNFSKSSLLACFKIN